jgi:hypothetical protein
MALMKAWQMFCRQSLTEPYLLWAFWEEKKTEETKRDNDQKPDSVPREQWF